jgi:uncharacterized protein YjbI with pentapeptide repeats
MKYLCLLILFFSSVSSSAAGIWWQASDLFGVHVKDEVVTGRSNLQGIRKSVIEKTDFSGFDWKKLDYRDVYLKNVTFNQGEGRSTNYISVNSYFTKFENYQLGDFKQTSSSWTYGEIKNTSALLMQFHNGSFANVLFDNVKITDLNSIDQKHNLFVIQYSDLGTMFSESSSYQKSRLFDVRLDLLKILNSEFSEVSLKNVTIRHSQITHMKSLRGNMLNVSFSNNQISYMSLKEMDLQGIEFSGGYLKRSEFVKSDLRASKFTNIVLENVTFDGNRMDYSEFENVTFINSKFIGVDTGTIKFKNCSGLN